MIFTVIGQSVKQEPLKIIHIPLVLNAFEDVFKLVLYVVAAKRLEFNFQLQILVQETSDSKVIDWMKRQQDSLNLKIKWIFEVQDFDFPKNEAVAVFQESILKFIFQNWTGSNFKNLMILHQSDLAYSLIQNSKVSLIKEQALHVFLMDSLRKSFSDLNRTLIAQVSVPLVQSLQASVSQDDFVLIYYGDLNTESYVLEVLDAFDLVHATRRNLKLHIIGSGPQRQKVETVIELKGLEKAVEFYHEAEWKAARQNLVGCVHASPNKTISIFALEAMASGLPLLLAYSNEAAVVFGEGAPNLVPAQNSFEWAKKMAQLVDDLEFRKQLAQKSLKTLETRFPWEHMKTTFQTIFNLLDVT